MCGFAGFVSAKKEVADILNMTKVISYRGPDDSSIFIDKFDNIFIHLGHVRLSIQDLSSNGRQPFASNCSNYVIVYNGEVYNFKTIRQDLQQLGYRFISNTDTEVILYAYKEWGINAVEKFIGMFAFAVYDKIKQKLILVRDRAGVKPLFFYDKGTFLFGSELKSFHQYPKFKKILNKSILPFFFQYGYIPAPYTIFKNCYKLLPGHYLEYDFVKNDYKIIKYWDVVDVYNQDKFEEDEKTILNELEKILVNAVNLRMVSDVPVGVFLSGGYDSSLVAALLQKSQIQKINTFTIGFHDNKYNEANHAKMVADVLGTNHTEYYFTEHDMFDFIEKLPFYYDEPFGDSSALPTMLLSKIAKRSVKVALSADGGDETFVGYSKYFALDGFSFIVSNGFSRLFLKSILSLFSENNIGFINSLLPRKLMQTNIKDKYQKFKRAIKSESLQEMFVNASAYVDSNTIERLLRCGRFNSFDATAFSDFKKLKKLGFIERMMAIDYKTFMVDDVLTKIDRATMSASLEGREPLLDHRIIEYVARVPMKFKYKNRQGKYLVRQILYKYIPKNIIDRPKSGFQIPLYSWLKGDLRFLVEEYLNPNKLDKEIFDLKEIEMLKSMFFSDKYIAVSQIWFIIVYEMWKERWL